MTTFHGSHLRIRFVAATALSLVIGTCFRGQARAQSATQPTAPSVLLAAVPEVMLDVELAKLVPANEGAVSPQAEKARARITELISKAHELNKKEIDGFVRDLRTRRSDLQGLPFAMGNECRMAAECLRPFAAAGESVHQALDKVKLADGELIPNAGPKWAIWFQRGFWDVEHKQTPVPDPDGFLTRVLLPKPVLLGLHVQRTATVQKHGPDHLQPEEGRAQVAALMQVLAPEAAELRVAFVGYLARMPQRDATRALAKLAIFSEETEVRGAASTALEGRDGEEYRDILVEGLKYPWPVVAERTSRLIAKLGRSEFIPQLIDMLDESDPRAPRLEKKDGNQVLEVREIVRINHHRNCLLCHAPGNTNEAPKDAIKAAIPVPGEPFPSQRSYQDPPPNADHVVRIDVTYLRQDFSRYLPVAGAAPWPAAQRFDFLTRTRAVTEQEAESLRAALHRQEHEGLSPYRHAALATLRELTGQDAEPTAQAWRKRLNPGK